MEALETAQSELSRLEAEIAGHDAHLAELVARRDQAAGGIRGQSDSVAGERKVKASGVPADLLALYDRLRESKGGVGAAALRHRRCGGCGLELSPADLNAIRGRATDDVVRCEECSRILVRTADSGL
ncbi:MAG: C4-type zinc ribbon domain-containing protein [Nocardioidaceae bacterium]